MTLDELNALDAESAQRQLLRCCGSRRWAREMTASRPFDGVETMARTGDAIWSSLDRADWLEAFAAHPRIGERTASAWAAAEQSGSGVASADARDRLAAGNRDYEARFGYIFIVCATGKSADEMLAMLERRLGNDPENELAIAAEQQRQITQLRLGKLLDAPQAAKGL